MRKRLALAWLAVPLAGALAASAAPNGPAATLFVTNTKSDSISVIDTATFEVLDTIPLGPGGPNRIAMHPDGRTAWVVYDKSRDIGVVDTQERTLVRRVRIGGNPYNLAFGPDGRSLWVLDWGSDASTDEVIVYDLATGRVQARIEVSTWPAHGVFTRDGRILYVSGETAGDLTVIDTARRTIVERIVHGGGDAMGLALTADGRRLYAAAGENKNVLKIDTATHAVVGTIPLPGIPHEAVLTLDGRFLYLTLRKMHRVAVIRTADDALVTLIPQRGYPDMIVMDPTGRYAFVTNRISDLVAVIDVRTHTQLRTIPVGKGPHGMALRPR